MRVRVGVRVGVKVRVWVRGHGAGRQAAAGRSVTSAMLIMALTHHSSHYHTFTLMALTHHSSHYHMITLMALTHHSSHNLADQSPPRSLPPGPSPLTQPTSPPDSARIPP